jgi:hypothetical protein
MYDNFLLLCQLEDRGSEDLQRREQIFKNKLFLKIQNIHRLQNSDSFKLIYNII